MPYRAALGSLYKLYRDKLSVAATHLPGGLTVPASGGDTDYNPIDAEASGFGNAYRGLGILVAGLGVLVAWSELYPEDGRFRLFAHMASLALLVGIGVIVLHGNRSDMKAIWLVKRKQAEDLRYAKFDALIRRNAGDDTELRQETLTRLDEQITYNRRGHAQHHNLKLLAEQLGLSAFLMLLANALFTLLADLGGAEFPQWVHSLLASYWLFKALPALAVGLASANGFLRAGQLADDHRYMAEELEKLKQKLSATDTGLPINTLAKAARDQLGHRDSEWLRDAKTLNLQAGG